MVNDLHGSIVSKCGAEYSKTGHCTLQVPNGETADYGPHCWILKFAPILVPAREMTL